MATIQITLPKGKAFDINPGQTLADVLQKEWPGMLRQAVGAKLDGKVIGLSSPIEQGGDVEILTCKDPEGLQVFWHSASHLMAAAVKALYPPGAVRRGTGH